MDTHILICTLLIILVLSILLYRSKKDNQALKEQYNEQIKKYELEASEIYLQKVTKLEADLEARTALLVDVSHEIRSRLHGVVSLSEVLVNHWEQIKENDRKKHINAIFEASFGLINFMNDLLDFSKFNAGKMVFHFNELNLAKSIEEALDYCKKLYPFDKKVAFSVGNKKATEAQIEGDKARINQLIMNLFINAIKYTEKGKITAKLELVNHNGKNCWKFSLSDEGKGIPEDELENIFEPFIRGTQNKVGKKIGSGLGLAMCKEIIEAHSGEIWAENKVGKGAKFSFVIPALKQAGGRPKNNKLKSVN